MRHTSAYYSNADLAGVLTALAAVNDPVNQAFGDNVQVPTALPFIGAALGIYDGTAFDNAQLQSPSLLAQAPYDISPITMDAVYGEIPPGDVFFDSPIPLKGGEYLRFFENGDAGGAVDGFGFVEFVDGPPKPSSGKIFTVRATGAATLVAGQWVNTPLTLDVQLPSANFDVVGLRAEGPNLLHARLVFNSQVPRPGTPGCPTTTALQNPVYRKGGLGVWGSFTNQTPPTIDCIGSGTDTTQVFFIDLIQK